MSVQHLHLTTALRPSLQEGETLLFVQDGIGLYEGKYKVPNFQNGQAYLTSHRVCYVDNEEPRKYSVFLDLKEVDRYEFYAGFLKSSPKITFYPKLPRRASSAVRISSISHGRVPSGTGTSSPVGHSLVNAPPPTISAPSSTWICPICSFSNPVPSNFDPATANSNTPLPPCLSCGIKPQWTLVLKAAISSASHVQHAVAPPREEGGQGTNDSESSIPDLDSTAIQRLSLTSNQTSRSPCPRCTFLNHPSLTSCEICGAPLRPSGSTDGTGFAPDTRRIDSPGPSLSVSTLGDGSAPECLKFSFRAGGDKTFFDRLKGAMIQRKWLLQGAPQVPRPGRPHGIGTGPSLDGVYGSETLIEPAPAPKSVGIARLEQRGLEMCKNNELVIGQGFEDLEALMASAKEIVALAEKFSSQIDSNTAGGSSEASAVLSQSVAAMGLITTKDMLGQGSSSEALYLSQLSRNLAEYLTDDATGVLRREGGIMSLVDLWAVFNRARGGAELVSPLEFEKAAGLWEKLKLPVRLRRFKSGLLVVQAKEWNDQKVISALLKWLKEFHSSPDASSVAWDQSMFGKGITPLETADKFGWSVGVASEELEMAEEQGFLCREEGVEGLRFWENWLKGADDPNMGFGEALVARVS